MHSFLSVLILLMLAIPHGATAAGLKSNCNKQYAPEMPTIYPELHVDSLCKMFAGKYQVTVRKNTLGGDHKTRPTFTFHTDATGLPYRYTFINKFYPSTRPVRVKGTGDGEIRFGSYTGQGIFCDELGVDFVTVTRSENGEYEIYNRLRLTPAQNPDELLFWECSDGLWGSLGILKKVSGQ